MTYIYFHKQADTKEVFYIGKGTNKRAWHKTRRNKYWKNIVKLHGYEIEIVLLCDSDNEAFFYESELIKEIKPKANFTNPLGNGSFKHIESTKQNMKLRMIGNNFNKLRRKPVINLTNGEVFESLESAAKSVNGYKSNITVAIKKNWNYKNCKWRFL
jgi:hypothetical protein